MRKIVQTVYCNQNQNQNISAEKLRILPIRTLLKLCIAVVGHDFSSLKNLN